MSQHVLNVLQNLLTCLRSYCSIRYVIRFLPNGSLAPRLDIYNNNKILFGKPTLHYNADDDCDCSLTDSNVLYTSSSADFDVEDDDDVYIVGRKALHLSPIPKWATSNCLTVKRRVPVPHSYSSSVKLNTSSQHPDVPVYYIGSFSNVHTSSPNLPSKPVQPSLRQNNDNGKTSLHTTEPIISQTERGRKHHHHHRRRNMKGRRLGGGKLSGTPTASSMHDSTSFTDSDGDVGALSKRHPTKASQSNRITQLEAELSRLRSQIAQLILAQEMSRSSVSDVDRSGIPHRPDADGESDTGRSSVAKQDETKMYNKSEGANISSTCVSSIAPPPPPLLPPPPPPPPLPPMLLSTSVEETSRGNWRDQLQEKLRAKKNNSSDKISTPLKGSLSASQHSASGGAGGGDMSSVLKELQTGSIKLRTVPRSPGGTPIRQKKSPIHSGSDPCAIIARALQAKFSHLRSLMDNSVSDEENSSQSKIPLDSGLGPGCDDIWSPKRKTNDSPSPPPLPTPSLPFGQHMLRSVNRQTNAFQ
uniref:Mitochondrial fission regulator 2 n=1 Tax=Trichobilharzia regenti TaxID=157069 RepID=A0AA85J0U9_TRIRE|nr:unnamed protein product [Trichobilharzia regenti]